MKLFDLDSPLMRFLNKAADLMWLNILTLICCIPVITIGPALTALHYMALKIVRDEECYITKDYFKSFRLNFRQGVLIWLIELAVFLLLAGDFYILRNSEIRFGRPLQIFLTVAAVAALFAFTFTFPVLAKFDNTLRRTFKNAFFIGILQFPKAILMMILSLIPPVLFVAVPQIIPIVMLFGFSVPAWCAAWLYSPFFKKLEEAAGGGSAGEEGAGELPEEDGRIFRDELDENLLPEEPPSLG